MSTDVAQHVGELPHWTAVRKMAAGAASPDVELSNREIQRYGRQMILPEWGRKGDTRQYDACM